jgi:flagellar motor protein MotB
LAPEIDQKLVEVVEDGSTVRVRTTVGQLFQSGSDGLEAGRSALFERIGRALEGQPGQITIEGHADSDAVTSLQFPDNMALSNARAEKVAAIIQQAISNPGRITVQAFGDTRPIASNDTSEGKTRNRRVEVIIPRKQS